MLDRDGGQVVRVLAFSSNNLSLNTAEWHIFSVKFAFERTKIKNKSAHESAH